jgi:hypothetical protein
VRNALPAILGACLLASPALSQIDYSNPVVETLVTRQQILDYTATLVPASTGISARFLVVNSSGNFVFVDRGNTGNTNFGQARLIEVDISGDTPVFTTLATEAQLAALLQTSVADDQPPGSVPARLNFNGLAHRFEGGTDYYYLSNFGQLPSNCATCQDEILEVAVTGIDPPVLRRVGSKDGIVALSLFDDYLYFSLHDPFSNQETEDGIWRMNIATGLPESMLSQTEFQAFIAALPPSARPVPAAIGVNGTAMATDAAGNFLFFSETFGGRGTDDFLILDPSTFVADPRTPADFDILVPFDAWLPGGIYENPQTIPGLTGVIVDANNTTYAFDQFPVSGNRRLIIIEDDGTIHYLDLPTLLGITSGQSFFPNNSFTAVVESPSRVVLYGLLADTTAAAGNPRIVSFTFTDPSVLLIELESFSATAAHSAAPVNIEWVTSSEIDSVGFNVRRAKHEDGKLVPGALVNESLIPAEGTAGSGASYSIIDPIPVGTNESRAYFLIEVDANGQRTPYGPFQVALEGSPSAVDAWSRY